MHKPGRVGEWFTLNLTGFRRHATWTESGFMIRPSLMGGGPMRIPRLRFTVRRLMVAAAIAAIATAGWILHEPVRLVWSPRALIQGQEIMGRRICWSVIGRLIPDRDPETITDEDLANAGVSPDTRRGIAGGFRLTAGYREDEGKVPRAARYPWLPVAPDPPLVGVRRS